MRLMPLINSKKGMLALEALIGVVLAVIGLFLVVNLIVDNFLDNSTNFDIAKENAESVKDFLEFSLTGDYANLASCYNIMRFYNSENFQYPSNQGYFFYVIDSSGVYVLRQELLSSVLEKGSMKGIAGRPNTRFDFGKNINMYIDLTDEGTIWSFYGSGSFDSQLNLEKTDFVIIEPNVGTIKNSNKYILKYSKDYERITNDNCLGGQLCDAENSRLQDYDVIDSDVFYLVFDIGSGDLFFTTSEISSVVVKQNLCSNKYLVREITYEKYKTADDPRNIEYINNKITIGWMIGDDNTNLDEMKFVWDSKPVCLKNDIEVDCSSYLGSSYDTMSYSRFVDSIENYYKDKYKNEPGTQKFYIIDVEEIDRDNLQRQEIVEFKDVFSYIGESINEDNLNEKIEEYREDGGNVYSMRTAVGINNIVFNGVENELSNTVFYSVVGDAYFYIDSSYSGQRAGYYKFNIDFLRKLNVNTLIYNSEEITITDNEKLEFREKDNVFSDNKNFYKFVIPDISVCASSCSKKDYEIVISSVQFGKINTQIVD